MNFIYIFFFSYPTSSEKTLFAEAIVKCFPILGSDNGKFPAHVSTISKWLKDFLI